MSKAGIQSNRGDGYQTLIAFDWALSVLSDPDFRWIEVDSTSFPIDDVVIGKADGSVICCQCKKNSKSHKAWSIAALADELRAAIKLLHGEPKASVRFYSRSSFGQIAALREFSANYADAEAYQSQLKGELRVADREIKALLQEQSTGISSFHFLGRVSFEVTPDFDRMQMQLRDRLRYLASNSDTAYEALWGHLDHLGMRLGNKGGSAEIQHRLEKEDLQNMLASAGSMVAPPVEARRVRDSFRGVSAVGRSWRRDIGHESIQVPAVGELLAAIETGNRLKSRSILLTGLPGSGKTCVMLAVQEALENIAETSSSLVPIFIQSREFADVTTPSDRVARGLPEQWVERAARIADDVRVVVMIDSLDVLSIAREHAVLTYFLAQIDQLLLAPNITVVVACREFDRQYDRRISGRKWSHQVVCQPLDWSADVEPLLAKLGIAASAIDSGTRELIRNPRELSLYVELAKQVGGFSAITSQALAQCYLAASVRADPAMGDAAVQILENIADEMLRRRSLMVSRQKFSVPVAMLRALSSANVLQESCDGQLTFGHQTLLDALAISGALRRGISLNEFIQEMPPVPFVRPVIRNFVLQLASADRREFRKQLRTVLAGDGPFSIRRLVAETFAGTVPHDEDWPLVRDLRNQHREVFQVLYVYAEHPEWHRFWMTHLIPAVRAEQDTAALTMHFHRISQWLNDDAKGITKFWGEVLELDEINREELSGAAAYSLTKTPKANLAECVPLIAKLLEWITPGRSQLGKILARCIESGFMDDATLWHYITREICDDDLVAYRLNDKLRCAPHEFGDEEDGFLQRRLIQSVELLDLAIQSIQKWEEYRSENYGGDASERIRIGLLYEKSYNDTHSDVDHRIADSLRFLLDSVEAAVSRHARNETQWWEKNAETICLSRDATLLYFGIKACIESPERNSKISGRVLSDMKTLEYPLSFEAGDLIKAVFPYLEHAVQDRVLATILKAHMDDEKNPRDPWRVARQAQLVMAVPCHMRSIEAQNILDEHGKSVWMPERRPSILMRSGVVTAPFEFKNFLDASDEGVLRLLAHYKGYQRDTFDESFIGGERDVGAQLKQAASRCPLRFFGMLVKNWDDLSDLVRDEIMGGAADYLAYCYGNLRPSEAWEDLEKPNVSELLLAILNELERHPGHWQHNWATAKALESCAHVVFEVKAAERLIVLAGDFLSLEEESSISGDSIGLVNMGINMSRGHAVTALMNLGNHLNDIDRPWPPSLADVLRCYAGDRHPAVRAVLLRYLPQIQDYNAVLGWNLFDLAMESSAAGLWELAEPCLYYAYHENYSVVEPRLFRLLKEGAGKELEIWGRISALAVLSGKVSLPDLIRDLYAADSADAWRGAVSVWAHAENAHRKKELCFAGLSAGLAPECRHAGVVARKIRNLVRSDALVMVPIEFLRRCFNALESEPDSKRADLFGFDEWINSVSLRDPQYALEISEIYLEYVRRKGLFVHDYQQNLTQLLTRLFAQAEEQEEVDSGAMLRRVVNVQDALLALGVSGVSDWLRAAERP